MLRILKHVTASLRLGVAAAAIVLAVAVPAPIEAGASAPVEWMATAEPGESAIQASEEDGAPASSESEGSPLRPVLGFVLIGIVFVVGLRAVKRQRDEGRRSKLPPIG